MPTISQLPSAGTASSVDEIPISQDGIARAISVGALLASAQPAIILSPGSLLGRTSLGSGSPEQVNLGTGVGFSNGTLVANGLDHSAFPIVSTLSTSADLVVSNRGSPVLMQTSLLRGLFSAGQNVAIDPNGVISAATAALTIAAGSSIGELQVVTALAAEDLVAVSHAGSDCSIAYSNFLGGVTIDQAQAAGPAGDADTIWTSQGSNVMTRQTFSAIWVWMANKLPSQKAPVVEITINTNLDTTVHNRRILICSQPVTLTPLVNNMGSGFQCIVINASSGNTTLGSGFVSSSSSLILAPWQTATLFCATYSGGTIAFAAMPGLASAASIPGQTGALSSLGTTATTIMVSWQPPSTGGTALSYIVQFRPTGATSWSSSTPVINVTTYQLTALQPSTGYDITVEALNATGTGAPSTVLTVATTGVSQPSAPPQVSGLTATPISSSAIQIGWSLQTGTNAATSFTIQYRLAGSTTWTSIASMTATGGIISGLQTATSYDVSVIGANAAGLAPTSSVVTAMTRVTLVVSITWNLVPSGTYTHGNGTIGLNALVLPAAAPIKFGFSLSANSPPTNWTNANLVNNNLWGTYVPAPSTAGYWYAWAEGLDGSATTVSPTPFLVQ